MKLLVIDDNPQMPRVIERALSTRAEVVALSSAAEALSRIERGDRFDAILCDLRMPMMSGRELLSCLAHAAPDQAQRLVFMSGDANGARGLETPLLEKPFTVEALRRQLDKFGLRR
jgi:CheY-like chemotaxis protein